jgi:hypothetical protein
MFANYVKSIGPGNDKKRKNEDQVPKEGEKYFPALYKRFV